MAAVAAFLKGKIRFGMIARLVEEALERLPGGNITCAEDVYDYDEQARAAVGERLKGFSAS